MFVVGNFDVADNQTATLPEGTWYNYFEQTQQTTTDLTLAPGEVKIFTGREVKLPEMQPFYCFMTDLEDVIAPQPTEILPPYNVQVYTLSGQVILQQTNVMAADLNALGSGMYIVQYEKNGQRVAKKVIR